MSANTGQRLLMTGSTFAATWAMVQHGGEGAIIAAVLASVVFSSADTIVDKFAGRKSSRPEDDPDYPTEEEIAAYRRLQQQQPGQGKRVEPGRENEEDLELPRKQRGPFLFSSVLERFTPSLDKIYLASLPDGTPIFCNHEALCL